MTEIGDKVARLRWQAEFLESLERAASGEPKFLEEVHRLIGKTLANGSTAVGKRGNARQRKPTKEFKKIAGLFTTDDVWKTIPEICEATGLKRGTVNNVLHKSRKDDFDKKDHPESKKLILWRLRPGAKK